MTEEHIYQTAGRAREAQVDAETKYTQFAAAAARADKEFNDAPSAEAHAASVVASKLASNARAALEELLSNNVAIFAEEMRERLRAELEQKRPDGRLVKESVARIEDLFANFHRDLTSAYVSLHEAVAGHNAAAERCVNLSESLGEAEAFGILKMHRVFDSMNAKSDPRPSCVDPERRTHQVAAVGHPEAPSGLFCRMNLPLSNLSSLRNQ